MAGTSGWNQPNWVSSPPGYGYYSYDPNGTISGTVQIRLKWKYTDREPPATVNVVVSGHAWASSGGTATANNGFESKSGPGDVTSNGTYLIQKAGAREIVLTYSPSVSGASNLPPGRSRTVLQVGLSAELDSRFARVYNEASPTNYAKVEDGTIGIAWPDGLFLGETVNCTKYVPQSNFVNDSDTGTTITHDYGLGLATIRNVATNFETITYRSIASQKKIPNEIYSVKSSLKGTQEGETLPSSFLGMFQGWDIRPLLVDYEQPLLSTFEGTPKLLPGDMDKSETITLKYSWQDGLKATATLKAKLHAPTDNWRRIGPQKLVSLGGRQRFAFVDGSDWAPAGSDTKTVVVADVPWYYKVGQAISTIVGASPNVVVALTASAADAAFTAGSPQPTDGGLNRGAFPGEGADYGVAGPPAGPISVGDFAWRAEYEPERGYQLYVGDAWDMTGFKGMVSGAEYKDRSCLQCSKRFFYFRYAGA